MIKVNFCDFWPGFEANNLFIKFLQRHFPVVIDTKPDYLFYSVYGSRHLGFKDCVKILYTGENIVPDFNLCDYAIGFHYIDFGDRYIRFPLYAYYEWYYADMIRDFNSISWYSKDNLKRLVNRNFCNFVYSNNKNSDPARDTFYHQLSKYKKVDSGGRHMNNIGYSVPDKIQFIKDYKFTIAFENSAVPGYSTEKLLEPIIARSLPVYYGNPLIQLDFVVDAMIHIRDSRDFDRAIEEIIRLDNDDQSYLEKLSMQKFKENNTLELWERKLLNFFKNIFGQSLSEARRKSDYGFNKNYFDEMVLQAGLLENRRINNSYKVRLRDILKRI